MSEPLHLAGGLGGHHQSEAVAGALPHGRNSPQRPALGLFAEQLSGTAFTVPRHQNRRAWLYRRSPSAAHGPMAPLHHPGLQAPTIYDPNRIRWSPRPLPETPIDWLDSLVTIAGNGCPERGDGVAIHTYAANASMQRAFASADGELLFIPEHGTLQLITEFGPLTVPPGHIALIPRGVRIRVELAGDAQGGARGWTVENHGAAFELPELGPLGSNGLASPRDFIVPRAAAEDPAEVEIVSKHAGRLYLHRQQTPFDVLGWHGNLAPVAYDLARFNTIGTVSFDHPDPSIFTVLTSPSERPGTANADFVIFPDRWMVAEDTFRPPWFHRNIMSEYMGLIRGVYDAKEGGGFVPGGGSLHNRMTAHGPDAASHAKASAADLAPVKLSGTLAFMIETRLPYRLTQTGAETPLRQSDYDLSWSGF